MMRAVFGEDMYIVYFQKPASPMRRWTKDVGKSFAFSCAKRG